MALFNRATCTLARSEFPPSTTWRQLCSCRSRAEVHSARRIVLPTRCEFSRSSSLRRTVLHARSSRCKAVETDERGRDRLPENAITETSISYGEDPSGASPSWLRALPHVLTAAMANFLFGYHIGIINGPLESMARELGFDNDKILQGLVVSIFVVGAFVGSIGGGILTDKIGRRRTFQVDAIPLILGSAISASCTSIQGLLLGRLMVGVGIGVNTALVPLYISEVAPTRYRGALASICQVGTCIGIIAVLLIGVPAETDPHWWRTMFWIGSVPGLLLIGGMQLAAESPRWLVKVGRLDAAEKTIGRLWGKSQVREAMAELTPGQTGSQDEALWSELASSKYIKVVAIGSSLFALQQFSGINGILYFSSTSFQNAGVPNEMVASAAVGAANLVGALVALSLMDGQGRQKLLQFSYCGMAASIALLVAAQEVPLPDLYSHSLSIAGTLSYVFCFALGAGPVSAVIIPELCDTRVRAKVMAVSLCVHWVCNFAIGLFFLELVSQIGLSTVYTSFGAVSLLAAAFAQLFIVETKGKSLEEIQVAMGFTGKDK